MNDNYKKMPWQKNFLKIPQNLLVKLEKLKGKNIVVACVKKVSKTEITKGVYSHLGFHLKDGNLEFDDQLMPDETAGKYSFFNVNEREIVRKDLPMIWKTFTVETPNFGDWSYGSHDVSWDREVYQREYIAPKDLEIKIEKIETLSGGEEYFIKFEIDCVLSDQDKSFQKDLLACLNLLQENVGLADIFETNASKEEYLATLNLDWEILPQGNADFIYKMISSRFPANRKTQEVLRDRIEFFNSLHPEKLIVGHGGFNRYLGALIEENLVIFENIRYGNAIYIMFENWEELSQRSRLELIQGTDKNFERVVHSENWKDRVIETIEANRKGLVA